MENELVDTAGEGESGTDWESSIDIHTPPCVKQIEWEATVSHRESSLVLGDNLEEWEGKDTQEGGDIYIYSYIYIVIYI